MMPSVSKVSAPALLGLLALLLARPGACETTAGGLFYTNQFQHWYPQYGFVFEHFLHQNCSEEYARYLTGYKNQSLIDWYGGGGTNSVLTQAVTNCILNCASQYLMATMTSAQVLLGVTPTILALLGASSDETAMLWVVGRRPFLSLLLAAGSPSLYFSRAFENRDPMELLRPRVGVVRQWRPRPENGLAAAAIAVAEYMLAGGAVANILHTVYQLGLQTICIFMSDGIVAPIMWWVIGIAPHLIGAAVSRLRISRVKEPERGDLRHADRCCCYCCEKKQQEGQRQYHPSGRAPPPPSEAGGGSDVQRLGRWLLRLPATAWDMLSRTEGRPCVTHRSVYVRQRDESMAHIAASWFLSVGTIIHIIFGSLVLASTLFIGPRDALGVIGRLMASVLVCRAILMYELAGLRDAYNRSTTTSYSSSSADRDRNGGLAPVGREDEEKTMHGMVEESSIGRGSGTEIADGQVRPR